MFIWTQPDREGYGQATGPLPPQAVGVDTDTEVLMPNIQDGPIEGSYRRLHLEQELVVTAQGGQQMPVYLHSEWTAYTKTWTFQPGGYIPNKSAAIEDVRQALEDACELAISKGHISISAILTASDGGGGPITRVDGRVVLIRPSGS